MGSKYDVHILDPYINQWSYDLITKEPEYFKDLANQVYINQPLGDLGQKEIGAINAGRVGDTFYSKMLRQAATRNIETLKNSTKLGASAMARGAGGSNASTIYQRLLAKQQQEGLDKYSDQLAQNMPGYIGTAGQWAEAPNRGLQEQASFRNMANQTELAGMQMRQSNMRFDKKKSFWDKFKDAVGVAGQIAGIATGLGGLGAFGGGGGSFKGMADAPMNNSFNFPPGMGPNVAA